VGSVKLPKELEPLDISKEFEGQEISEDDTIVLIEKYKDYILNGDDTKNDDGIEEENNDDDKKETEDFSAMSTKSLFAFIKENKLKIKGFKTMTLKKLRKAVADNFITDEDDNDDEYELDD